MKWLSTPILFLLSFALFVRAGAQDGRKVEAAEKALKSAREAASRNDKEEQKRVKDADSRVKDARKDREKRDKQEASRVKSAQKKLQSATSLKGKDRAKEIAKAQASVRLARDAQNRRRQEGLQKIRLALGKLNEARRWQNKVRQDGQRRVREATRALQNAKNEEAARKRRAQQARPPSGQDPEKISPDARRTLEIEEERIRRVLRGLVTIRARKKPVLQVVEEFRRQIPWNLIFDRTHFPDDYVVEEFIVENEPAKSAIMKFARIIEATVEFKSPVLILLHRPSQPSTPDKPQLSGRVARAFQDSSRTLLDVVIAGRSGSLTIYLSKETSVSYVDIPRAGRRPAKGYLVSIWLRKGSRDQAARAVFTLDPAR